MSLSLPSTYMKIKWHVNHVALIFSLRYVDNAVIKKPGIFKYKSQVRNWLNKDYTHFIRMMIWYQLYINWAIRKQNYVLSSSIVHQLTIIIHLIIGRHYIISLGRFYFKMLPEEWFEAVWDPAYMYTFCPLWR